MMYDSRPAPQTSDETRAIVEATRARDRAARVATSVVAFSPVLGLWGAMEGRGMKLAAAGAQIFCLVFAVFALIALAASV